MRDKHFTSRMLTCAGALMCISGILMAVGAKLAYEGHYVCSRCLYVLRGALFPHCGGQGRPKTPEFGKRPRAGRIS